MVAPTPFAQMAGELSGRALGAWLRTGGASLFRIFETGAEVYRFLQDNGVEFSRSAVYNIRSQVLAVSNSSQRLVNYADNQLIPQNWHIRSHGLDLSTDYQYRVRMYGNDPETGILKEQVVTVVSDRQLTKSEVKAMAREYMSEYDELAITSKQMENVIFGDIQALKR